MHQNYNDLSFKESSIVKKARSLPCHSRVRFLEKPVLVPYEEVQRETTSIVICRRAPVSTCFSPSLGNHTASKNSATQDKRICNRSKERQEKVNQFSFAPGTAYLSVLIANWKLLDSYRRLQLVVNNRINSEEEEVKHRIKLGYGSRFNSARPPRPHPESGEKHRPHSVVTFTPSRSPRSRSTLSCYNTKSQRSKPFRRLEHNTDLSRFKPIPPPVSVKDQVLDRLVIDGTLDEIFSQKKQFLTRCDPLWYPSPGSHSTDDMLSVPDIPGGGLRRETTSFGVYSNLAAHSRREPTKIDETRRAEPLTVVTSGLQLKLIQAIKQSDIEQVQQIFEDYPDLKLHFVDENDRTVLHHCVDVQKRIVHSDILKLLLEKNLSIIDYCKNEAPVLHNAARIGHALSVYFLLKHGADVNLQYKRTSRTALHEAVINGHKTVVEILLFNGANLAIREREGRFACDLCKDNVFPRGVFDTIEDCVANKRIEIHGLAAESSAAPSNNVGVTAQLTSQVVYDLPILIKREMIEMSNFRNSLPEEEDIAGDVFSYRLLQTCEGASVRFFLPLFDKSFSSREEVVVKNGSGHIIVPHEMQSGKHGLVVVFDTVLRETESFVCVCRPKIEHWQAGKGQTVLGSVIDEQVRIHINKNTFNTRASLSLQVIELPEVVEIKEDIILACTPFYKIDVDQKASDLTVELPTPCSFDGDGQCAILAKSGSQWGIMKMQTHNKHNTVSFTGNNFPVIATVAVTKPNSRADSMTHEVNETLKLVSNIEYQVTFLYLTKRVAMTRKFTVAVECCEVKFLDARLRFWKGQGYQEQQQKDGLAQLCVQSKQAFKVVFYDSAILRKDPRFIDIEFHRKRENIIQFTVELKGKSIQCINGRVYVFAAHAGHSKKEDVIGKEHLSCVDINLVLNQIEVGQRSSENRRDARSDSIISVNVSSQSTERPVSRADRRPRAGSRYGKDSQAKQVDTEPQMNALEKVQASLERAMRNIDPVLDEESAPIETTVTEEETTVSENSSAVFLDDVLLDLVVDDLGDDWYKIFVLAGLPFVEIEEFVLQSKNMTLIKKQLFRKWRDRHQDRADVGLPFLLGALFKGGCRNVATTVQIKLKNWYEKWKGKDNEFQKWVTKAYHDSNLFVPSDYPKPMSDSYLVLMSDELPPTRYLSRALLIADSASDDVLDNPNYVLDGIKVMKLFTLFRDRTERSTDALEKLISVLEELGFEKLRKYAIMCAKAWLKRTATRKDDPLRYQVDILMNKLQ